MSEYSASGRGSESVSELTYEGLTSVAYPPVQSVQQPLDPDSQEADALRGALSFLFALITSYDELVASNELAGDSATTRDSEPR